MIITNTLFSLLLLFIMTLDLDAAQKALQVLTRNAPTTYYYGNLDKPVGFEHDLVEAFAQDHDYKVEFILKDSIKELVTALQVGEGDLAVAGLTRTPERVKQFFMGPGYLDVREEVVCAKKSDIRSLADLDSSRLEIIAKSSYSETLRKVHPKYPKISWKEHKGYTTEHIFERMAQGKVDCTVADSHIVAINRRYYPHLHVAFTLSEKESLSWMLPKRGTSVLLQQEVTEWFKTFKHSQRFAIIKERYFSHVELFDYVDIAVFHKRMKSRLPKYIDSFRRGGKKYGIDWRLLAAQAYQESHWDPRATSPTGVRGMMMLTLPTAKAMDVNNRLNYRESIDGGAKYLTRQIRLMPKSIKGHRNRAKFALAAYNIGRGHLYDAINLGKKLGKDPYVWVEMKKILPLLSERKHYKELRYGYARGNEPVRYVTRINNYYDILTQSYKK